MKSISKVLLRSLIIFPVLLLIVLLTDKQKTQSWGFYVHRKVNRNAVYTLPPEMLGFYKKHIEYISEHAVDPDKRSMVNPAEGVRHYIDIDHYGANPFDLMPRYWKKAVEKYTEDTLQTYGINPWHINKMMFRLTQAFRDGKVNEILWVSSNIGHYIADANVPLHTSEYYDGKIPAQKGIHAFWETGVPLYFAEDYNLIVGKAEYIPSVQDYTWELIERSHHKVDTIFEVETLLRTTFPEDKKFGYFQRGQVTMRTFSRDYAELFTEKTNDMVQRQMRNSVHAVGSLWYTAWVNAGQPDLRKLDTKKYQKEIKQQEKEMENLWKTGKVKARPNPVGNDFQN